MKKIYSLLTAAALTLSVGLFGQTTIAEWAPNSTNAPGGNGNFGPSPFAATTSNSNVVVGGLTRGAGILTPVSSSGAAAAWGGTDVNSDSFANAVTANDYATFTITPNSGYILSLTRIEKYNVRRSSTGATTGQWQYKVGSGEFTNIGSAITWGSTTSAGGNEQPAIDLSGIEDLQDIPAGTTVTFRVVTWGGTATGGTWYLVNGNASATSKTLTVTGNIVADPTMSVTGVNKTKTNLVKNTIVTNEIIFGANAKVSIYNNAGQLVKVAEVKENASLDVSSLAKGNYIVSAVVNGKTVSQKIIKK